MNPELDKKNPYGIDSSVKITMKDGTLLENSTNYLKRADSAGTMQFAAMDEEKVVRKFRALTDDVLTAPRQEMLISTVLGLPRGGNARSLWHAFDA